MKLLFGLFVKMNTSLALVAISLASMSYFYSSPVEAKSSYVNSSQPNHSSSTRDSSGNLSQLNLPVYLCDFGVEQTNPLPPNAVWGGSIACVTGSPVSMTIEVYYANVNFPNTYFYVGTNKHYCNLGSYCSTPKYSRPISRTQILYINAYVNLRGYDGVLYTDKTRPQATRAYNNVGVMYPQIKPTRLDMPIVPFTVPPYTPQVLRDSKFSENLTAYYQSKKWTIPPRESPRATPAHHIKPLLWGGSNDFLGNGVFLGEATHNKFTSWWGNFSNLSW